MEQHPPAPEPDPEPVTEATPDRRKVAWIGMGALLVALILLGFLSGPSGNPDAGLPPPAADGKLATASGADPDDAKASGKDAPLGFTLKDMNGVEVKLASFKGKVILLNFWATWCGPCRAEIPSLVQLQQRYGDQLVVLGVSIDDPLNKLKPYATEMHMNYPVLVGKDR